jgi:type 1 glutamine amidotransferase
MPLPILLISSGIFHPPLAGRLALRRTLESAGGFSLESAASLEGLTGLDLNRFGAVVLYFHHKSVSSEALRRLEDFLQAGGGCLGIHSASASYKGEARFFELLGGRFSSHGPVETYRVLPAQPADPIFGSLSPFEIRDERYLHEYNPGNTVHFYTTIGEKREPVVWTRRCGAGRACYCSAGHTVSSLRHPAIQQILIRGLRWAAGEPPSSEAEREERL